MPPTIRAQSALAVHVAKRVNPTGQARMATLKVFTSAGKINRTLLRDTVQLALLGRGGQDYER